MILACPPTCQILAAENITTSAELQTKRETVDNIYINIYIIVLV